MGRRSDRRVQGGTVDLAGEDNAWWSGAQVNHTFVTERPVDARERATDHDLMTSVPTSWISQSPDATRAYRALGIDWEASWDEVVTTYRNLARRWHPDRLAEASPEVQAEGVRRMTDFNAAYDELRKLLAPSKRALFTA